jgi:hypothetical protein
VGAILEAWRHLFPAAGTKAGWFVRDKFRLRAAGFVKKSAAPVAFQKRLSAFDGNQGNEEKANIMIQPLASGRRQAAGRAGPRLVVNLNLFRLHSANEDEDAPPGKSAELCLELLRSALESL